MVAVEVISLVFRVLELSLVMITLAALLKEVYNCNYSLQHLLTKYSTDKMCV